MLIVELAMFGGICCLRKMVASTAFATRSGWSVCTGIPWSVCPGIGGQLAPESGGLVHQNLHQANLYQQIGLEADDEDDYYGTGKILITDYISFIGETSGAVYQTMKDMLNEDFNERSGTQDFEATVVFDKRKGKYKDRLGYERKK